jgi:uncharacterized SAM-binding protein YcdF (DUF218 family)
MFFALSKILGFFAIPSNLVIVLALAGAALVCTRFARAGRRLMIGSVLLLAIIGLSPLGNALILPLEERFPAWDASWDASRGAPAGIISLGGALDTVVSPVRGEVALNEAAERVTVVAELARRYPQPASSFQRNNRAAATRRATASRPLPASSCSARASIPRASCSRTARATPSRMRSIPNNWRCRGPANAGCW